MTPRAIVDAFAWDDWNAEIRAKFAPVFASVLYARADVVAAKIDRARKGKTYLFAALAERKAFVFDRNDPFLKRYLTRYVGERIKTLDGTTRDDVVEMIRTVLDVGGGAPLPDIARAIEEAAKELYDGYETWRANAIARTETAIAYNNGTALACKQAGVKKIRVIDGDGDEECARADGQIWTVDEFLANPIAHPNCTRDGDPVIE